MYVRAQTVEMTDSGVQLPVKRKCLHHVMNGAWNWESRGYGPALALSLISHVTYGKHNLQAHVLYWYIEPYPHIFVLEVTLSAFLNF